MDCDSKTQGFFFVSKYMVKKYGNDEAITRTIKSKNFKFFIINPKNSTMPVLKKSAKVVKAAPKKSIAPKKAIAKVMKKK